MTLIYSATLPIKFQDDFTLLFNHFEENNNKRSAAVPALVKIRGRANRKLGNKRQDHEHSTRIHGDARLKHAIETPNISKEKTMQWELLP